MFQISPEFLEMAQSWLKLAEQAGEDAAAPISLTNSRRLIRSP